VQHAFIKQRVQQRRIHAGQQHLPRQPGGHQFFDLLALACFDDGFASSHSADQEFQVVP
jgi:hypothetical protein